MKPVGVRRLTEEEWKYLEHRLKEGPTKEQKKILEEARSIYRSIIKVE